MSKPGEITITKRDSNEDTNYIISSNKGTIRITYLPFNYLVDKLSFWEICCLKGDLFDDVERFRTLEEARTKAKEYLIS